MSLKKSQRGLFLRVGGVGGWGWERTETFQRREWRHRREVWKFLSATRQARADVQGEEQASFSRKMPFLKARVPRLPLCVSSYWSHVYSNRMLDVGRPWGRTWSKPVTLPMGKRKSQLYNAHTEAGLIPYPPTVSLRTTRGTHQSAWPSSRLAET